MRGQRRLNFFSTYIVVQVKGSQLEQFLNTCLSRGFHLWNTERLGPGHLIVSMHPDTFRRLRRLGRQSPWQLSIVEKHGPGFTVGRLRRRRVFLLGSLAALLIWYVLSVHVWFIHVEGNESVATSLILDVAKEAGLAVGVHKNAIVADQIQRHLLLQLDRLIWAGVEIRGTRALIRIAERLGDDGINQGPGNIVAGRDGVIERIAVFHGTPVVEPGDTVRKGQILISGLLPPGSPEFAEKTASGEIPYIRAAGTVQALVWHETSAVVAVAGMGETEAAHQAADIARALTEAWLAEARAEQVGELTIDIDAASEPGNITARALIQAIQDIGTFEAVVP